SGSLSEFAAQPYFPPWRRPDRPPLASAVAARCREGGPRGKTMQSRCTIRPNSGVYDFGRKMWMLGPIFIDEIPRCIAVEAATNAQQGNLPRLLIPKGS